MADIDITITPGAVTQETFTDRPFQQNTILPRGRLQFSFSGVITAKIATNSTTVTVNLSLPSNFAYALESIAPVVNFATNIADAGHFNDVAYYIMFPNGTSGTGFHNNLFSRGLANTTNQAGSLKFWHPEWSGHPLLFNQDGINPHCRIILSDNDLVNATVVGALSGRATFLVYDVAQALAVAANTPQPMITR